MILLYLTILYLVLKYYYSFLSIFLKIVCFGGYKVGISPTL